MKKSFISFFSIMSLILINSIAIAAEANSFLNGAPTLLNHSDRILNDTFKQRTVGADWIKAKVGGEFRYRLELRDDFNLNNRTNEDDTVNLLRTRLNLDLTLGQWIRGFVEGQEAHSFAESSFNKTNAFVNELDLRQLFAELKSPVSEIPVTLKVGRQELSYGDQRFVGAFNWSNVARVFDAVKLIYKPSDWFQADFFFSQVVLVEKERADSAAHHDNFYGIYSTLKPIKDHLFDTFLFIRHNRDNGIPGELPGEFGQLKEYAAGNRFKGKAWDFDYRTEWAIQFGSRAHDEILAWALSNELGYTLKQIPGTPRFSAEYNHASGDRNSRDGEFGTFDNLFPTNHDKYGYIDFLSLKNMNDIKVGASIKPHARFSFSTDYHWFFLDTNKAPWFNAAQSVVRAASPNASTTLGQELDLLATYKLTEHLNFLTGFSHFFSGPFVEDTGADDDANFFYIQSVLNF